MKSFWLFRSNLLHNEYYHKYKDLETFEKNCHDFYLLLPLQLLKDNYFNEVIIWRLTKRPQEDIIFNLSKGGKYIQKWVLNFNESLLYPKPLITLFRGGFKEYDILTKHNPKFLGLKLYLGAGKRVIPQYGGIYNKILIESEKESHISNTIPFYKTANPNIFYPLNLERKYDICWPNNFTQLKYKGQEFFIKTVGVCPYLKKLKIVHIGNKPEIGKKLCKKYNVNNIKFIGLISRPKLNKILNQSKFGLVTSNLNDGCPRISTEILMSGTPLLIKDSTRLLNYYKQNGVIEFNNQNIFKKIKQGMKHYYKYSKEVLEVINNELSFKETCQKNIHHWIL